MKKKLDLISPQRGRWLLKLRKMKLTAILSLLVLVSFGNSYSQVKLTLNVRNAPVKEVMASIEEKTDYIFLYKDDLIDFSKRITVEFREASFGDVLQSFCSQAGVDYEVIERQIILREKNPGVATTQGIPQPERRDVTGTVRDARGISLPGVTVLVKGTTLGTITDNSGNFRLTIPVDSKILEFSFVGMRRQEVLAPGRSLFEVVLEEETIGIDEVVAIGYGTVRKSDLTGSVASVNSKDFVKGVASNALSLLSGKASGVSINQVNSEPGGNLTIRVRGAGSINSSNNVLVVIDGLPGGSVANINPADIESIDILKDASAAAIYGTRAANGVVLITTKKGSEGVPQISYSTYYAYQSPSYKFDVLDATQYMNYINDISRDLGRNVPYSDAQIAAAGKGTDWQDQLFRNAWANNHQFSVRGGSKQSKYYASLGYLNHDGILISSGFQKYNVLLNLETQATERFKFGINITGSLNMKDKIANESNSGGENADPLNAALMFDPRISPLKNESGEYDKNPSIALDHPMALAYGYDYREENNRFYGSTFGEFLIMDGLKATVRLGGDLNNIRNDEYQDRTTQRGKASGGIGNVYSNDLKYWLAEGLLNYNQTFGAHTVAVMAGSTWERFENLYHRSYATGFLSDVTNTNLLQSGNPANNQVNSSKSVYKLQSLFSRINYSFRDRYLITATIRRDGTSRFSDENKYALFPSVAAGWRVTEEDFMKGIPAISSLKLKFGYGQMGNEGIGNFETISTFVAGGNAVLGGAVQSGAQPARIPNPELTWETTEEYNAGVEFGVFNNRITGDIEYYVKNSIDQLFSKPVPMTTGFSSIRTNFGTVRNSGFDFSLTTRNFTGKFKWTSNFMLSTLKNEVVELPPYVGDIITGGILANVPGFALVRQGYPMRAFYGFKVIGIFQSAEEIAQSAQKTAKPGEPIFLDYKKDGIIDSNDRVILGDPFPDISYSLNNSFSYGNFNLEIYLLGVQGIQTFNANVLESMFPINFDRNVMTKHYLERWTPDNKDTKYPSGVNSAIYFGGGRMINSFTVQDASYLRVKNVTLSYSVPLRNTRLFKSADISLSGENLLTFTKFEGFDPEANQTGDGTSVEKSSYNNYPTARIFRIGATINF
ncbi:MAG: SusC/RagA family TonB-linked outer membrane protein [Bacteroidota bacterium]